MKFKQGYKFANRVTMALFLFKTIRLNSVSFLPDAGVSAEYACQDLRNDVRNEFTGGLLTNAIVGTEFYTPFFVAGASASVPLHQNVANGDLRANASFSIHLTKVL